LVPDYKRKFRFLGMFIAKAITSQNTLDVSLSKPLLKQILGKDLAIRDLADLDSVLCKSFEWLLENPVEEINHPFTYDLEILGKRVTRELIPDGKHTMIDDYNKKDYVKKVCWEKMTGEISEALEELLLGFRKIIPPDYVYWLTPADLSTFISGNSEIDIEDMKNNCDLRGYSLHSPFIQQFFEVLQEFSPNEKAAFLLFISGSTKVPYGGFRTTRFRISRYEASTDRLPIAHTCFYEIEIPEYEDKQKIQEKLLTAIFEGAGSFLIA